MSRLFTSILFATAVSCATTAAQAQSIEIYGGSSFGGQDLNYGPVPPAVPNLQTMDAGPVFGGGYYIATSIPQLSVGADVMFTNQDYSTWGPGSNLSTTSLMVNGRYDFGTVNNIGFYGGAGLGAIAVTYDDPAPFLDGSDTVAGYQLELGAVYNLGAYTTFTAIKYQAGFDEALIQTESVEYNSTSLLVGFRF